MSDRLRVLPQYLMPKRAMTTFAGSCAGSNAAWWTGNVIPWFIRRYGVDMSEAANPDPASYPTFNDFFTRALRDGVRPIADAPLVCPVDGAISQFGPLQGGRLIQAKGHDYSARALLGGDEQLAGRFERGWFATLYLSPRDYHRIHMPCDGRLVRMIYVPGAFFSVNPTTARGVPGLFARNERVVCVFETDFGPMVLALVGATIVGSMATVWHGVVNATRSGEPREWRYDGATQAPVTLARGQEMGRFLLGSTVVLLLAEPSLAFNAQWAPGRPIRLGEPMADIDAARR